MNYKVTIKIYDMKKQLSKFYKINYTNFQNQKDLIKFLEKIYKSFENQKNNISYDFDYKNIIINLFDFKKQYHINIYIELKKDNYSLFKKISNNTKVFKFIYVENKLYGSKTKK